MIDVILNTTGNLAFPLALGTIGIAGLLTADNRHRNGDVTGPLVVSEAGRKELLSETPDWDWHRDPDSPSMPRPFDWRTRCPATDFGAYRS